MSALPTELEPTQKLLSELTSQLGQTSEMAFGGSCLRLVFDQTSPQRVADVFRSLDARIDAEANLPGPTNAGAHMLLGEVLSVPFTARTTHTGSTVRTVRTEVQLFAGAGQSVAHAAHLDAAHHLADAVFATHVDPDRAVLSYLARRLDASNRSGGAQQLVAGLAAIVADYLAGECGADSTGELSALTALRR